MSQASQMNAALAKVGKNPGKTGLFGQKDAQGKMMKAPAIPQKSKNKPAKKKPGFSATKFNNQKAKTFGLTK